jgi:hypothetical protein
MPTFDTIYKNKKSSVVGREPASLTFGEFAVNTTDKILFVGGPTGGNVIKLVAGGPEISLSGPTANDLLVYSVSLSKWINIHLGSAFTVTGSTLDLSTVSGGSFDPVLES